MPLTKEMFEAGNVTFIFNGRVCNFYREKDEFSSEIGYISIDERHIANVTKSSSTHIYWYSYHKLSNRKITGRIPFSEMKEVNQARTVKA